MFFDKARLWNVIKKIITTLYMDGLIEGQKFLVDNRGEKWTVTRHRGVRPMNRKISPVGLMALDGETHELREGEASIVQVFPKIVKTTIYVTERG